MAKELNNLVSFDDFTKSWKPESAKKTARTETGLDVLAKTGKGEDVDIKKVTDKSKTTSNGLSKVVVK
jgi:hypothetical protein